MSERESEAAVKVDAAMRAEAEQHALAMQVMLL